MTPAVLQKKDHAPDPLVLSRADELRAQYVACSYLSSVCQDALGRFPAPSAGDDDRVAQKALEYVLAIEWDWRQTLQGLAEQIARASVCERPRRRREHAGR
jgi:hypothetical protein